MTGDFINGQLILSSVTSSGITVGNIVSAAGYTQPGTTILFILNGSQAVMSKPALQTGTGIALTFKSPLTGAQGTSIYGFTNFATLTEVAAGTAPRIMGVASMEFSAMGRLTGRLGGQGTSIYGFNNATGFLTNPAQGLTVKDVIDDILLMWGIEQPALAFPYLLRAAVHDLNGALQMIWSSAKDVDYFSRQTLTVTFPAGSTQEPLSQGIIAVLGPARLTTGQWLKMLSSRGQYDNFGPIFLGALGLPVQAGVPAAFFLERLNQATPDNVRAILHVTPPPAQDTTLYIDVSIEAPRYQWSDYQAGTPIEMFHLYADSVLLPFARYKAMSSQYFLRPERTPAIVADYQAAMRIIGAVDPALKEVDFSGRGSASVREAA